MGQGTGVRGGAESLYTESRFTERARPPPSWKSTFGRWSVGFRKLLGEVLPAALFWGLALLLVAGSTLDPLP